MKLAFAAVAAMVAVVSFKVGTANGSRVPLTPVAPGAPRDAVAASPRRTFSAIHRLASNPHTSTRVGAHPPRVMAIAEANAIVDQYCSDCHNDSQKSGNLSFENFDAASAPKDLARSERMIRVLRAELMPLTGAPRPHGDTLAALAATIEQVIDANAKPNPGFRTFQRLNRPEYERVVHDLLDVDVNAGDYLPLDTKSANFDDIADVEALSATLLDSYLNAASAVSRMAVGDKSAALAVTTYQASLFESQHPWDHVDGTPYGTRGGVVAEHTFPADGLYQFRMRVEGGVGTSLDDIDVSIDGNRVALLHYERGVDRTNESADNSLGADLFFTDPVLVKAGQHHVSAAFVRRFEGPYEDLIKPAEWSMASNGNGSVGTTSPPAVMDVTVMGPQKTVGVSETPSRRIVFSCHPSKTLSEQACAQQIITRLGTRAYRRPLTKHDRDGLMAIYTKGAAGGAGFETGIRTALQAMLASPYFVFRFESAPPNAAPGTDYQISDIDLASRLSFFLWGSIPDDELLRLAEQKKLSEPATLAAQVHRMLADPRADALSTRFGAQWLRLQDLDRVHPDLFLFPDYDQQLAQDMRHETELFFANLVREDRSVLELLNANYTFVNERLARHYGIPGVSGSDFRRVAYPDSTRRGILGQGSMLVQTSVADRTSPVLRGKWIMEVLIGMPPPPPPPNVPSLDETTGGKDGRPLTTRERMEIHRKNPTCNTCHQYMDPLGLSLDNFDVTGKWRYSENAVPVDTKGTMYDGTPVTTANDVVNALLKRPIPFTRTFTENLMAYAIGRRMEDADQPEIRAIARNAAANGYRMSSFISGVVNSPAFRSKRIEDVAATQDKQQH